MAAWISSEGSVLADAVAVAREMSDPIRLTVLQLLAHEGPHGMSQLAEILDITPARLGNHLTKLRTAGLVDSEHQGRHVTYRIHDRSITGLLDALATYAGGTLPLPSAPAQPERLCYDHAAGHLGVALLDHLLDQKALRRVDDNSDELQLGPAAPKVLESIGIDADALKPGRRKIATNCLDRSLRRPHLGGSLGHTLLVRLQEQGLVDTDPSTRTLTINRRRRQELATLLPTVADRMHR